MQSFDYNQNIYEDITRMTNKIPKSNEPHNHSLEAKALKRCSNNSELKCAEGHKHCRCYLSCLCKCHNLRSRPGKYYHYRRNIQPNTDSRKIKIARLYRLNSKRCLGAGKSCCTMCKRCSMSLNKLGNSPRIL